MKESSNRKPNASSTARRFPTLIVILLVAILVAGGFWWSKSRHAAAPPAPNSAATTQPTNSPASNETLSFFQTLTGRWRRADGGYIVEVRSVNPDGKMDAVYLNPRPINVAKAEAMKAGGDLKVFVELRDVNYPGSTYTLTYQPATDRLAGTYFHAVSGQNMDVEFSRLGEP